MDNKDQSTKMFIFGLLLFGGACIALAPLSLAGEAAQNRRAAHPSPAQPGMTISIDPDTGEMRSGSSDTSQQLPPSFLNSMSTSSEGLQEVESPNPNNGVKVNLQGRFQSPLVATRNAEGKLVIQHPHMNRDGQE